MLRSLRLFALACLALVFGAFHATTLAVVQTFETVRSWVIRTVVRAVEAFGDSSALRSPTPATLTGLVQFCLYRLRRDARKHAHVRDTLRLCN